MSSYLNLYNSYGHGAADNDDDLAQPNRESLQPPQGYPNLAYEVRPTTRSSAFNRLENIRTSHAAYQDVYSQAQARSSNSADLSRHAYTAYTTQNAQSLESSGLNGLIHTSALGSATLNNPSPQTTSHRDFSNHRASDRFSSQPNRSWPIMSHVSTSQVLSTTAPLWTSNLQYNGQSWSATPSMFKPGIAAPALQYVNPNELYSQQHLMGQERQRIAEEQAAEAQRRHREAEALEATRREAKTVGFESAEKSKPKKQSSAEQEATAATELNASGPQAALELGQSDDMATEMRNIIEKLRGMRSKDPSLFSKLWDDFKKGPTVGQTASESLTQQDPQATSRPVLTTLAPSGKSTPKLKEALQNPGNEGSPNGLANQGSLRVSAIINDTTTTTSQQATPVTQQDNSYKSSSTTSMGMIDGMPESGRFPVARQRREPIPNPEAGAPAGTMVSQTNQIVPNVSKPMILQQEGASVTDHMLAAQQTVQPRSTEATELIITRRKLAQVMSDFLMKESANKEKQVSPESLMSIIKGNPTYPDLCSLLESRGLSLDRQAMARFLLKAVPSLNSSQSLAQDQKKKDHKAKVPPQPPQVPLQPPQSVSLSHPAPRQVPLQPPQSVSLSHPVPTQPPLPAAPQMIGWNTKKTTWSASSNQTNVSALVNGKAHFNVPAAAKHNGAEIGNERPMPRSDPSTFRPPRANLGSSNYTPTVEWKADLAKKRLFSEIVDLTQLSDNENDYSEDADTYLLPSKQPRLEVRQPPAGPAAEDPMDMELPRSLASGPPPADLSRFAFNSDKEPSLAQIRKFPGITTPLKDAAALERIYYNPKMIARDILIAAGRHPSEPPLNHHLMKFQNIFSGVTAKSDLETFRWDIVDPGGPPMPIVEPEDILTHPPPIPHKRRQGDKRSRDELSGSDKPLPTSATGETSFQQLTLQPSFSSVHTLSSQGNTTMVGTSGSGSGSGSGTRRPRRSAGAKNKKPSQVASKVAKIEVAIPLNPAVPDPSYPVFACDWNNCQAQLHDINTLKVHVNKLHVPRETSCRWHGCPNAARPYTGEELRKHLELAHIQPLAWQYGDGPSVNGTALLSDQYLKNGDGTKITPNTAVAGEIDSLIFPVESTPVRAYHRLHGIQAAVERARGVLKAVQNQRKKIGFGLEQAGCELANFDRNAVVSNDEEVFEVVSDEDDKMETWFRPR